MDLLWFEPLLLSWQSCLRASGGWEMAQLDIEQVEGAFLKDNAPRACGMGAPPSQLCGTLWLHPPPHPKDPQTPPVSFMVGLSLAHFQSCQLGMADRRR